MSTEAALKAISNTQLASNNQIPAVKHRTVNDAIIEELFNAQSRGDVLSGVKTAGTLNAGDVVLVIRGGQAYLLDASTFGFVDALSDLTDVNITSPSNLQLLSYDTATSKWIARDASAVFTGGDISGTGTVNKIAKFSASKDIADSNITDDGTTVTINASTVIANDISIAGFNITSVTNVNILGNITQGARTYNLPSSSGTLALQSEIPTGVLTAVSRSLGTNATTVDADSNRTLNILTATYTASTTLTFSNVTNLFDFTMQLTNTNANVLTFAGITVYFKSDDLPSGVTFASNALTFPADSAVQYNIVGVKFDGSTFDCKIESR